MGLVCAPTRELCQQIYHEARKFSKVYGLRVCKRIHLIVVVTCVFGGRYVQLMEGQASGNKHKTLNKGLRLSWLLRYITIATCYYIIKPIGTADRLGEE